MGLANFDLDSWIVGTPLPHRFLRFVESRQVGFVRPMLADFESAVGFDERCRQIGMAIEEESVGDEHQVGVGP